MRKSVIRQLLKYTKKTGIIYTLLAVTVTALFSCADVVYAETTVNTDRDHKLSDKRITQQKDKKQKQQEQENLEEDNAIKIKPPQEVPKQKEMENIATEDVIKVKPPQEESKQQEIEEPVKQPVMTASSNSKKIVIEDDRDSISKFMANHDMDLEDINDFMKKYKFSKQQILQLIVDTNEADELPVTSEAYFKKFILTENRGDFDYDIDINILKRNSEQRYMRVINLKTLDEKEYLSISALKTRSSFPLGVDTFLRVRFNMKINNTPLVFTKKKQPVFEVCHDGKTETVKINKITSYVEDGFRVETGNVKILDSLKFDNADYKLLVQTSNGEMVRIPISSELMKLICEVGHLDLLQMKRDQENQ